MQTPSPELAEAVFSDLKMQAVQNSANQHEGDEHMQNCHLCAFAEGIKENRVIIQYIGECQQALGILGMLHSREVQHMLIQSLVVGCQMGRRMGLDEANEIILGGKPIPPRNKIYSRIELRLALLRARIKAWVNKWL